MYKYSPSALKRAVCALTASTFAAVAPAAFAAWEPTKPVEFVVPGRNRWRRRPDGALAARRYHQE